VRETAALVDDLAKDGLVTGPRRGVVAVADDAALAAACRREAGTYNHHSGTCRLGDPGDERTVVAPDLTCMAPPPDRGRLVGPAGDPARHTNLISMAIGYRAGSGL